MRHARSLRPSVLLALLAGGCWLGPWPGGEISDVGFLYVGPIGDHGWTKAHDDGRLYLEENLEGLSTHYEPSVLVADALEVMEGFVAEGDDVLITTSYDFISSTQNAAANHPEANFLNCSGFYSAPNMGSYFGRMYQAWYLAGMVAGHMAEETGSDRIGVVGPVVIPETVRHLNALTLGARQQNPDAQVHVEWIHAWLDTDNEPLVAEALIAAGATVIVNKTDTTIALETVQTHHDDGESIYSIGYDNQDSCSLVGDSCLTAPYWNWGPLYLRLVQAMADGSWDPYEQVWDQMLTDPEQSTVHLAELNEVLPSTLRIDIENELARLADEDNLQLPFQGRIKDNAGSTRVAEGDEMNDEELLRMCWYVEGIIDADGEPAEVPTGCGGDY